MFVFLTSISLTVAIDQNKVISYTKLNGIANINIPCTNSNGICASAYTCNVTQINPDGELIVQGVNAVKNYNDYNVSLSGNTKFGVYTLDIICNNGTANQLDTYYYEVTADGNPFRSLPQVLAIALFGLLLLIGTNIYKVDMKTDIFKIFGAMLLIIAGIITLYPGFNYINYSNLEGLGLGVILIGVGGTILGRQIEGVVK